VYIFHEKFKENLEQLDYVTSSPMILPEKVLLSSENCTNSQLGKYVTKKFDDLLSHPLFEKNKPSTEMIRFMENQTLRIYAFGQSYCYTILPVPYNLYGIYDPVENYEILDTYGVAEKCCEIVRINENYMDNNKPEIVELDIGTFSFIEAGSSNKMLRVNVTTFNLPIEKINNNRYRVYVDSDLNLERVAQAVPGYISTSRTTASNLGFRSIHVGYNSGVSKREIKTTNVVRTNVKILTTWMMQDGYLNIVTDTTNDLSVGQFITIRNSTKNSVLNGTHRISEVSDNSFVINFRIPINMNIEDLQNINANFDLLNATKVYCNVEGLSVGNEVVFDYASGNGNTYPITEIGSDEYGVYLLINAVLDNDPVYVAESAYDINFDDHVIFSYEGRSTYYNVTNTDILSQSLWISHLPDSTVDGRFGNKVSFIELYINEM
jgi:hypothetical protein